MSTMNIDKLLKRYNLSQKELSESTRINRNAISKYCTNSFEKVDKNHLDLFCKYFKCTPNDLFDIDTTVEVIPAQVLYYDDETDELSTGEIQTPSNAFKRRANWNYSDSKNPMPTLRDDVDIPESVQKEFDNWVNTSVSQPDFQIRKPNGEVITYEVKHSKPQSSVYKGIISDNESSSLKNRKFQGGHESLEKENPKSLLTEEDIIEMEQMQSKLDLEFNIESNVNSILNNIVLNCEPSIYEKYKNEIDKYNIYGMEEFNITFKLIPSYRLIYNILSSQSDSTELLGFLTKLRNIYAHGGLLDLNDNDLQVIANASIYFLNEISKNKSNTIKKD